MHPVSEYFSNWIVVIHSLSIISNAAYDMTACEDDVCEFRVSLKINQFDLFRFFQFRLFNNINYNLIGKDNLHLGLNSH